MLPLPTHLKKIREKTRYAQFASCLSENQAQKVRIVFRSARINTAAIVKVEKTKPM